MEESMIDCPDATPTRQSRSSKLWRLCGRRLPRSEIVFFCQMVLIYVVVGVSLFNLTSGDGPSKLWVALLASCLGYILPHPTIDPTPVPQ